MGSENIKHMEEFIEYIEKMNNYDMAEYFSHFGEAERVMGDYALQLEAGLLTEKKRVAGKLVECLRDKKDWLKIHVMSFLMHVLEEPEMTNQLLDVVLDADYEAVGEYNKLSHYWQISNAVFQNYRLGDVGTEVRLAKLYACLFQAFAAAVGIPKRAYIPLKERNQEEVVVFTSQVLGLRHAPTKTLLDRCYVLQKHMNKKVYIINTAMQLTSKGAAPFYRLREAGYESQLLNEHALQFKDETFSFYQCENKMPDLDEIASIAAFVKEHKPLFILDIGGNDICADICGRIVPEVTLSTVFSKISMSCGQYQIVDKELSDADELVLRVLGVRTENVVRSPFTFVFKEQEAHFTREQLHLWDNAFVLLVTGWRLDEEVSDDFLDILEQVISNEEGRKIQVAFMGKFESYEQVVGRREALYAASCYLGRQEDVLAVAEQVDLYVNPKRSGGGSSAAEALYKGIPVVTLPFGDVSAAVGKAFEVSDYDEMGKKILEYAKDRTFYKGMSEMAKTCAEELLDSRRYFGDAMGTIEGWINDAK